MTTISGLLVCSICGHQDLYGKDGLITCPCCGVLTTTRDRLSKDVEIYTSGKVPVPETTG